MNDDPSMVDVLYAKVKQGANILQQLADGMVDYFVSEGIMTRQYDKVKMHVTVMNSLMLRIRQIRRPRRTRTDRRLKEQHSTPRGYWKFLVISTSARIRW